jgi:hypothetical protein
MLQKKNSLKKEASNDNFIDADAKRIIERSKAVLGIDDFNEETARQAADNIKATLRDLPLEGGERFKTLRSLMAVLDDLNSLCQRLDKNKTTLKQKMQQQNMRRSLIAAYQMVNQPSSNVRQRR